MVTTIPQVRVTRVEATGGYLATCSNCSSWRHIRPSRPAADDLALDHQRSHGRMDPADQINDLDGWRP